MRRFNVLSGGLEHESVRAAYRWRATQGIGDRVGAERIGAGLFELEDGELTFPYHFHYGIEEWLYVIAGTPTLRTPAGENALEPGDLVCFRSGAEGAHTIRGPGRVMIFSANRDSSIVAYPDSDKLGTRPADAQDRLNFPRGSAVDYWEGE